jgi:hypothetical protein
MCGLADFWQWEYRPDLPRGQKHTKSAEWVSLTDEEVWEAIDDVLEGGGWLDVARALEAAIKEKNT